MEFNVWAAARTLKGKIGRIQGFNIAQRLNPYLTEEEWDLALHEARQHLANRLDELSRPLNRRPVAHEIGSFRVKKPGGFLQQVEVYVRDRDTGLIDTRHFSVKTDTLRARMNVVKDVWAEFLSAIESKPDEYPEEVVGVAYVGTYSLIPRRT